MDITPDAPQDRLRRGRWDGQLSGLLLKTCLTIYTGDWRPPLYGQIPRSCRDLLPAQTGELSLAATGAVVEPAGRNGDSRNAGRPRSGTASSLLFYAGPKDDRAASATDGSGVGAGSRSVLSGDGPPCGLRRSLGRRDVPRHRATAIQIGNSIPREQGSRPSLRSRRPVFALLAEATSGTMPMSPCR